MLQLFRNKYSGELLWSDEMFYESEFDGYIHELDQEEYYMDDEMADIEVYELLDKILYSSYKNWCFKNKLNENDYGVLVKYFILRTS